MRFSPLALLLPLLAACATSGGSSGDTVSASSGDAANGATLFADNCASCHGADAQGDVGPDIAGISDSNEVIDTILNGDGMMPAFADTLSDQDISDILAWLGSLG